MGRQSSKSGGTLKHTTGLMKLKHMHMVMDFKENLKQQQAEYMLEQLRARQTELMCELMELDLAWEAWFDDDRNVPAFGTIAERVAILERRVAALKVFQPMELRPAGLAFIGVPAGVTLPSFSVAAHVAATQGAEE